MARMLPVVTESMMMMILRLLLMVLSGIKQAFIKFFTRGPRVPSEGGKPFAQIYDLGLIDNFILPDRQF